MLNHPAPVPVGLPPLSLGVPPAGLTAGAVDHRLFCLPSVRPSDINLHVERYTGWTLLSFDLSAETAGKPSILGIGTLGPVPASCLLLFVDKSWMADFAGGGLSSRALFYLPAALRSIATAVANGDRDDARSRAYRSAKIFELLCETVRMHDDGELIEMSESLSARDKRRVVAARQVMLDRYGEKITIDAIGRACGLSRTALIRDFKAVFDCTIAEALNGIRLDQACEFLRHSSMTVAEIGFRVGYLSNAAFSRAFQKRHGLPPARFRSAIH